MSLQVHKYGGTSVANADCIRAVAGKIATACEQGDQIIVVVSAMADDTDQLISLSRQVSTRPHPRELDVLLATGEQITIALLSMALQDLGHKARSYTGTQARIRTDQAHNRARIRDIDTRHLRNELERSPIVIIAGSQGVDEQGNITTLGRGGSDTTAVALAAALDVSECRIYTDVDGVYNADPRLVPGAQRIRQIAHEEMLEMASLGAKVLRNRAVEFASKYNIALRVLSSFEEGVGTLITTEDKCMEQPYISAITHNRDEAKLTLLGVPDKPGIAYEILGPVAKAGIEVDMIIQNISENKTTDFTFTVHRRDYKETTRILKDVANSLNASDLIGNERIAKISIVGLGMRSHAGIASKMFQILGKQQINIMMISTSEIKISVVVEETHLEKGVRALHSAFALDRQPMKENAQAIA